MTAATWHISDQAQFGSYAIPVVLVALIVFGIWSIVGRIRDDERRAADEKARREQLAADRLAAHTFCRDLIPDSSEVMVTDAGLPQFGRRAVA